MVAVVGLVEGLKEARLDPEGVEVEIVEGSQAVEPVVVAEVEARARAAVPEVGANNPQVVLAPEEASEVARLVEEKAVVAMVEAAREGVGMVEEVTDSRVGEEEAAVVV
jgi:hypothetical protein